MNQTAAPTTSPQTQALLELVQGVIQGKTPWAELVAKIEARRVEMDRGSDEFFGGVEKQGADFKKFFQLEIDQVEAQFGAYDKALETILGFEKSKKMEDLAGGSKALHEASLALRRAMSVYEQRYLSNGPNKFPIVNLFQNIARGVAGEKKIAIEALWATCHQYRIFYQEAVAEIDRSEAKEKSHVPERREALTKIIKAIDMIAEMEPAQFETKLGEALTLLADGHEELDASVRAYNQAAFGDGPTSSVGANWVINTAKAVLDGKMPASALEPVTREYLTRAQKTLAELQAVAKMPVESRTLLEEIPKMLESIEWMEDALKTLLEFCEHPDSDPAPIRETLEDLTVGAERLVAAKGHIDHHNETYGKVVCPHCQHYNAPSSRSCEKCQRQLPQLTGSDLDGDWGAGTSSSLQILEGGSNTRDSVMTEKMKTLFDACEALRKGETTQDAVLHLLDQSLDDVAKAQVALSKFKPPPVPAEATPEEKEKAQEFIAVGEDALELLVAGADECGEGLERMRQGVNEDNHQLILEGQKLFYDGTQKMWQVKRVDDMLQAYIHPEDDGGSAESSERLELSTAPEEDADEDEDEDED